MKKKVEKLECVCWGILTLFFAGDYFWGLIGLLLPNGSLQECDKLYESILHTFYKAFYVVP